MDGAVKCVDLGIVAEDEPGGCLNLIVGLPFDQSVGGLLAIPVPTDFAR